MIIILTSQLDLSHLPDPQSDILIGEFNLRFIKDVFQDVGLQI